MAKKVKKLSDKKKLRAWFLARLDACRTETPRCRHFGECGGCEFQDVPHAVQTEAKREAFGYIAGEVVGELREKAAAAAADTETDRTGEAAEMSRRAEALEQMLAGADPGLVPSPLPFGYRQRMDYVFAFGKAGLRRANRHRQVVDLEECPLLGDAGFAVFRKARTLAEAAGLESYDYMRHTGELRYFVVRRSRTGGILLSLVTKSRGCREAVMSILEQLTADGDIVSGHWLLAEGLGDVSFGEDLACAGEPAIAECMNGISLRIGPNTFFQSNPAVAERAYAAIRDFVPLGGSVLDMYSGVGSIALTAGAAASSVMAVENVPDNVTLAQENIRENRADTVRLIEEDSAEYLRALADDPAAPRPDLLVVNPPRPGVEGDGMASVLRLGPGRFAYLSCNPFTLLRNLSELADEYALHSLTIYDMFPQTRHFETLALLERKG